LIGMGLVGPGWNWIVDATILAFKAQ
jgi:hypothetical protein